MEPAKGTPRSATPIGSVRAGHSSPPLASLEQGEPPPRDSQHNFLERRAARKAELRPTTYSSIANGNPYSDENGGDTPDIPAVPKVPQHYSTAAGPRPLVAPPAQLNLSQSGLVNRPAKPEVNRVQYTYTHGRPDQRFEGQAPVPTQDHSPQGQAYGSSTYPSQVPRHILQYPTPMVPDPMKATAPRMPVFAVSSAFDDLLKVRQSIAPEAHDKLGPIAVDKDGIWMFWMRYTSGRPGGVWISTSTPVDTHVDPRIFCPTIHDELIKACDEGRDEHEIWRYYELLWQGMDKGRQRMLQRHAQNNPEFISPSRAQRLPTEHGSPVDRGRSASAGTVLRPILKSPVRNKDDRSSAESSRNVMFDLYRMTKDSKDGMPSEVTFRPATRPYQRAQAVLSAQHDAQTQYLQQQHMPQWRAVDGRDRPAVAVPASHVQPDLFQCPPELRTPVHFGGLESHRDRSPAPFPWQRPVVNQSEPDSPFSHLSAVTALPPPMFNDPFRRHHSQDAFIASGPRADMYSNTRQSSPSRSLYSSSLTKYAASEFADSDELVDKFPGRLGGESDGGSKATLLRPNSGAMKFFGSGAAHGSQTTDPSQPQPTALSPIHKFAGRANKWLGRKLKEQPSQIMRSMTGRLTRSASTSGSIGPPSPGPSITTSATAIAGGLDEKQLPKISISPDRQMLLLGKVEFTLNQTANTFMMQQKEAGRVKPEAVAKVTRKWFRSNRPLPTEFMFDLKTQMELVQMNEDTFMFHTQSGSTILARAALLQSWRNVLRELEGRTFCLPDHALKKFMIDAFRILEMLGGDVNAHLEFRKIQIMISEAAARAAREQAKTNEEEVKLGHGETRNVEVPESPNMRGDEDDDDVFYDDGIYRG